MGYKFADKWSPRVALSKFTQLPNLLILHQADLEITAPELNVIIHILYYKWTEDYPYPSAKTLGDQIGMAEHTVRTHLRNLERKRMLIRVHGNRRTNEYDFTPLLYKLESYPQIKSKSKKRTMRNRTPYYSNTNSIGYSNADTELDAVNYDSLSKRTQKSGKLESLGDIMATRPQNPP